MLGSFENINKRAISSNKIASNKFHSTRVLTRISIARNVLQATKKCVTSIVRIFEINEYPRLMFHARHRVTGCYHRAKSSLKSKAGSRRCSFFDVVVRQAPMIEQEMKGLPIITRAGTAFHSSQKVMKELVTRIIPGMKTVVK